MSATSYLLTRGSKTRVATRPVLTGALVVLALLAVSAWRFGPLLLAESPAERFLARVEAVILLDGEDAGFGRAQNHENATFGSTFAHDGDNGVQLASTDEQAFVWWGGTDFGDGSEYASARMHVRVLSGANGESVDLLTIANEQSSRNFDLFVTGDTRQFKWDIFNEDFGETDFTVVPGQWYFVEVQVDFAGREHRARVRIDGVEQPSITSAGVDTTIRSAKTGYFSPKTHTVDFDNLQIALGDSPLDWIPDGMERGPLPSPNTGSVAEDVVAPLAPELRITESEDGSTLLEWDAVKDAGSGVREYQVWRDGQWLAWTTGGTTTYLDETPTENAVYQLRAEDGAGNRSPWSNPGYSDATAPPAIEEVVATRALGLTTVSWTPVDDEGSGVKTYQVWRNDVWHGWTPGDTTVFVDREAIEGAVYRIRAEDHAGNTSDWSEQAYLDAVPPPAPRDVEIAPADGGITLRWVPVVDNSSGVRVYHVWRDGAWFGWVPPDETTFFDDTATTGTEYQIRVEDVAGNQSSWSDPVVAP